VPGFAHKRRARAGSYSATRRGPASAGASENPEDRLDVPDGGLAGTLCMAAAGVPTLAANSHVQYTSYETNRT
jgi:hypothetical protein